jgi:hypothetical protein
MRRAKAVERRSFVAAVDFEEDCRRVDHGTSSVRYADSALTRQKTGWATVVNGATETEVQATAELIYLFPSFLPFL